MTSDPALTHSYTHTPVRERECIREIVQPVATVSIREEHAHFTVRITSADTRARWALIASFRHWFSPHGRHYARPLRDYWTLPLYRRDRLRAWLSVTDCVVDWPKEVVE